MDEIADYRWHRFLGRHLTTLALDWGHEVTLFNRGRHQHPDWRDLVQLYGDRDKDLRDRKSVV